MNREYHKWFSPNLNREMELLVFGHAGDPVLFFPTRTARFYDYEDWQVIEALRRKIESGNIQVSCLDSVDKESFCSKTLPPAERILRHFQYENYILTEVLDLVRKKKPPPYRRCRRLQPGRLACRKPRIQISPALSQGRRTQRPLRPHDLPRPFRRPVRRLSRPECLLQHPQSIYPQPSGK